MDLIGSVFRAANRGETVNSVEDHIVRATVGTQCPGSLLANIGWFQSDHWPLQFNATFQAIASHSRSKGGPSSDTRLTALRVP